MVIVCKVCYKNIQIDKEEVDIENGLICCSSCGNVIDIGLLFYFSKICKDIKIRYKKSGFKVTNVKIKRNEFKQ